MKCWYFTVLLGWKVLPSTSRFAIKPRREVMYWSAGNSLHEWFCSWHSTEVMKFIKQFLSPAQGGYHWSHARTCFLIGHLLSRIMCHCQHLRCDVEFLLAVWWLLLVLSVSWSKFFLLNALNQNICWSDYLGCFKILKSRFLVLFGSWNLNISLSLSSYYK